MAASLQLSRVSTVNADNKPQTTLQVTDSQEIRSEVFVYVVDDRGEEYDTYSSVATLYEIENLTNSRQGGAVSYLKNNVTIVYDGVQQASFGQSQLTLSLETLIKEYNTYKDKFEKNDTLEIS